MKRTLVWLLGVWVGAGGICWAGEASHRQAVDGLFEAFDMRGTALNTAQLLTDQFCSVSPEAESYRDEIAAYIWRYLGWDVIRDDVAAMYMEAFTESELREMTQFYRSPAGQKALKQIPDLAHRVAVLSQERFGAHAEELERLLKNKEWDRFKADVELDRKPNP